jgi:hypothetical protein
VVQSAEYCSVEARRESVNSTETRMKADGREKERFTLVKGGSKQKPEQTQKKTEAKEGRGYMDETDGDGEIRGCKSSQISTIILSQKMASTSCENSLVLQCVTSTESGPLIAARTFRTSEGTSSAGTTRQSSCWVLTRRYSFTTEEKFR